MLIMDSARTAQLVVSLPNVSFRTRALSTAFRSFVSPRVRSTEVRGDGAEVADGALVRGAQQSFDDVNLETVIALPLAAVSTTMTNLAYLREHDAAAALPVLSMRRPIQSVRLLLTDRSWLRGFALEGGGFALYATALRLASLAVVQSVGAGGIGVLAYVTARTSRRRLSRRRTAGVALSVLGLLTLGVSLAKASGTGTRGSTAGILAWLGGTAALAIAVLALSSRTRNVAVGEGLAGGMLFSIGDVSTKIATQGGARLAFVITLVIGYTLGTSLLQLGYQRGGALTVAGIATLGTNALPILAGTVVLHEPVPSGVFGVLRVIAFVAVTAGAVLLAKPDVPNASGRAPAPG